MLRKYCFDDRKTIAAAASCQAEEFCGQTSADVIRVAGAIARWDCRKQVVSSELGARHDRVRRVGKNRPEADAGSADSCLSSPRSLFHASASLRTLHLLLQMHALGGSGIDLVPRVAGLVIVAVET